MIDLKKQKPVNQEVDVNNIPQTMYDGKAKGKTKRILIGIMILFGILIGSRIINSFIWWGSSYLELKKYPDNRAHIHIFPILKDSASAKEEIKNIAYTQNKDVVIGLLFDLRYKNRLLIFNKKQSSYLIKTGMLMNSAFPGISDLRIYNSDIVKMKYKNKVGVKAFGNSILISVFRSLAKTLEDNAVDGNNKERLKFSYIKPPVIQLKYYQLPYLVYFFLPLILILLLVNTYGKVILLSAIFYIEMLLLFNIKTIFFTGPFYWIFSLFKIEELKIMTMIIIGLFIMIILVLILSGLRNIKKDKITWRKTLIILFFILLPLFLKF